MSSSSGLLLDIGILTRIRGSAPDPVVAEFLDRRRHQRMFISALSLCELPASADPAGAEPASADPAGADPVAGPADGWVRELTARFAANILPVDHHVALVCESGDLLSPAILAATARHYHLTVVSADPARYAGLDVRILNPLLAAQAPPGSGL